MYSPIRRVETDSGVSAIHMVAYSIPDQHQQTASHAEELARDAHMPRTYNICMTKPTSFTYRNTYNYMHRKSDKKDNIHHIHYTDTPHITLHNG